MITKSKTKTLRYTGACLENNALQCDVVVLWAAVVFGTVTVVVLVVVVGAVVVVVVVVKVAVAGVVGVTTSLTGPERTV